MRDRVIALGTGVLLVLSACAAETITMPPQETKEIYVVDQVAVEKINNRLDTIENKIDDLSIKYAIHLSSVEAASTGDAVDESVSDLFSESDVMLMARVVQAEYPNGEEIDKRMVVSVILNRLENTSLSDFKNLSTIESVVTQKDQFVLSPKENVTLETLNCVYKEIAERTDNSVLWFSAYDYPPYGDPIAKINGHYFSGMGD